MLILGVDPGLAATGYGLVKNDKGHPELVEGGVLRSREKDPIEKRVGAIFKGMIQVLQEFSPDLVSMEDLYSHYKHPKTAVIMAHARGAILAAADQVNIPVENYAATAIKMSLTGNGRASKEQVQQMVLGIFGLSKPMEPYDTTDALAAAICHINHSRKAIVS
jgi:crossover junction endodeoxyribonuclease RuvC